MTIPAEKIVRISDYERRSREPDAAQPRDPVDADVLMFPSGDEKPRSGLFVRTDIEPFRFI